MVLGMVKVAFVIAGHMYPDVTGGAEIFTFTLSSELARLGVEAHIIAYEGRCFRNKRMGNLIWHGVKMKVPFLLGRTLTFTVKALNILLRIKPDLCIANMGHSVFPCLAYAFLLDRPVLVRLAGGEFVAAFKERPTTLWEKVYSRLTIEASRRCDIIVLNRDTYITLKRRRIGEKIFLIPNPIKDEFFNVQPSLQGYNIIYVGALKPKKGISKLIEAFAEVAKVIPEARLILVGDGPLRPAIEKRIRELVLENKVLITGFIPNSQIPKILEKASVFVLPSYGEGLSNALLQAMAAGLPCIVSDIEENREIIQHGVNGLLFPVGDSKALAEALIQVLTDRELASKLGLMARESVKHLKLKNVVNLYLKSFLYSIRRDEGRKR